MQRYFQNIIVYSDIICSNDSIYCMHYIPNFKSMWLTRKTRISCRFLAFFSFFTAPELKIYVSYVYETIREYMSLHISNFRPLSRFSCQPHDLKVGFRARKCAMHHNSKLFSHFYCSITQNICELCI